MTFSPCSDDYPSVSILRPWEETPSHAPTPGYYGRERTPSVFSISSDHVLEGRSSPSYQHPSNQLGFLQDDEPENGRTNNRRSPSSLVYVIEWKVTLNNRLLKRDTEQDLVFKAPFILGKDKGRC